MITEIPPGRRQASRIRVRLILVLANLAMIGGFAGAAVLVLRYLYRSL
ncbi:hypothetical protein [Caulobacter rhizosphaerae]|nr:hypothetical protein [Caulobacter rhizosphaerae]GGL48162.1 hypothetical protein GCM10010983_51910 [Caulobacter rhizosphaerae]